MDRHSRIFSCWVFVVLIVLAPSKGGIRFSTLDRLSVALKLNVSDIIGRSGRTYGR